MATPWWIAIAALALVGCTDHAPQRAATDDCPSFQAPALSNVGSIAPFRGAGMLTHLKTRC